MRTRTGRFDSYPKTPSASGPEDEQKGDVPVCRVDENLHAVEPVQEREVLPVAHEPLRVAKVECVQKLAKALFGHRIGGGRPGENILGLQAVMVGEKLNSLHLLRTYPSPPAHDIEHGLIAGLEDQLTPAKARVVLKVGFPDAQGERVNEVRLVARRFQVDDPLRPFRPESRLQTLGHEVGEKVRVPVPSSAMKPYPVAIISDAGAVDLQVDDEGILFLR